MIVTRSNPSEPCETTIAAKVDHERVFEKVEVPADQGPLLIRTEKLQSNSHVQRGIEPMSWTNAHLVEVEVYPTSTCDEDILVVVLVRDVGEGVVCDRQVGGEDVVRANT